jgi:hypothetical protein
LPSPKQSKKPQLDDDRLSFLADRAAILLVVCKMRYGNDWNPFFREGLFEDEGSLGDEIRGWPEYEGAKMVIRNWIRKHDKRRQADGHEPDAANDA